jgi:hypothetical protein
LAVGVAGGGADAVLFGTRELERREWWLVGVMLYLR